MTQQELARKQAHLILADTAQRMGLQPHDYRSEPPPLILNQQTLMQALYLLQESCRLPTGYHFTLHTYGPQAKLWSGILPRAIQAAQEKETPHHDFQDHVTRFIQDHQKADGVELTLRAKLIYVNRTSGIQTLEKAVSFIRELSPQIGREHTGETWRFLEQRGLIRTTDQEKLLTHKEPK